MLFFLVINQWRASQSKVNGGPKRRKRLALYYRRKTPRFKAKSTGIGQLSFTKPLNGSLTVMQINRPQSSSNKQGLHP
jgi:hypothetical protein